MCRSPHIARPSTTSHPNRSRVVLEKPRLDSGREMSADTGSFSERSLFEQEC